MSKPFNIATGKYHVPGIGFVDTSLPISDEKLLKLYQVRRAAFPWISLGPDGIEFLKKQKLKAPAVAQLVQNATSPQEVEALASLSDTKTVARIVETRLKAFQSEEHS